MSDLVGVVRTLNEALERFRVNLPVAMAELIASGNDLSGELYAQDVKTLMAAASVLAGVVEVCPNCEGSGSQTWLKGSESGNALTPPTYQAQPCLSCRGGVVIKPELRLHFAKALCDEEDMEGLDFPCAFHLADADTVVEALWAVLGGEE